MKTAETCYNTHVRTQGSRNTDFEQTRTMLLHRIGQQLGTEEGLRSSFRELSETAGVSPATLRHYFKDLRGVYEAYFQHCRVTGDQYFRMLAESDLQETPALSMRWVLEQLALGLSIGQVRQIYTLGLRLGLESPQYGPFYLSEILEPTLQAVERRIERHQARGELSGKVPRLLALELVSPLFLLLLHQHALGGCSLRPMNPSVLIDDLVKIVG